MISFRKECLNVVTVQIYSISPAPPNNSPPFVRNPSLAVRNDNNLLTQFSYLAIICWVVWRLYIWLFGMHSFGHLNFKAPLAPAHALFFAYTQQLVCIFHFAIYIISLLKTFWTIHNISQQFTPQRFTVKGSEPCPSIPLREGADSKSLVCFHFFCTCFHIVESKHHRKDFKTSSVALQSIIERRSKYHRMKRIF